MQYSPQRNLLEDRVIKTFAYYYALGRVPLTPLMLRRHLVGIRKNEAVPPLSVLHNTLQRLQKQSVVVEQNGFYALRRHAMETLSGTTRRGKHTALKWKRARRRMWILPYIPYVREVGVTGSIVLNNASETSDIDVLTTAREGRIWTTRLFVTAVTHILGIRRHRRRIRDRLCFNHYRTEGEPFGPANICSVIESMYTPIWQAESDTQETCAAATRPHPLGLRIKRGTEWVIDTLLNDRIETFLSRLQIKKIEQNPVDYDADLPQLTHNIKNLLFFYPKVKETEKRYIETIKQVNKKPIK